MGFTVEKAGIKLMMFPFQLLHPGTIYYICASLPVRYPDFNMNRVFYDTHTIVLWQ